MKYTNLNCEACGTVFREDDDVVVCPVCGAPHHRACWDQNGRCVHEAAHPGGYRWTAPAKAPDEAQAEQTANQRKPAVSEGETLENGEEIVICPHCGSRNYGNDAFCLRCGQSLHRDAPVYEPGRTYQRVDTDEETQSRYGRPNITDEMLQSFRRYGGLHPNSTLDGIPVCEYSDFVGGGSPGKIIRKISTMERYGKKVSFMIPAFLFGPIWFLSRKMRKEGWIVGLILILLALFSGLLQINDAYIEYTKKSLSLYTEVLEGDLSRTEFLDKISEYAEEFAQTRLPENARLRAAAGNVLYYLAVVGIPLYSGLFGLGVYRRKVKEEIHRIRSECGDMQSYQKMLIREGGTSAGGAVIGILIVLTAMACYAYVPLLITVLYF